MLQAALVYAFHTIPSRQQHPPHRHWPCNRLVREAMCDAFDGLTHVNAEPLRRDIEVRVSAVMPLTRPCRRRVVSLWRCRAEFMRAARFSPTMVSALSTKGWVVRHSSFRVRALCFRRRRLSFCVPRLCFQYGRPWGSCPWPSAAASRICFRERRNPDRRQENVCTMAIKCLNQSNPKRQRRFLWTTNNVPISSRAMCSIVRHCDSRSTCCPCRDTRR